MKLPWLRKWWVPGALLGVLALTGYAWALPPDVHMGGDCGELAASAWCLGVSHPTGYPLYAMLGKLFTWLLPFGTISWRVAMLSAAAGAATVALVAWLVTSVTANPLAGLAAGLAIGLDNTFASQAVICEVYALHLALLAGLLLAAVRYGSTSDIRWLNTVGLILGLGLVHHLSIVLAGPAVVAYLIALDWSAAAPARWAQRLSAVARSLVGQLVRVGSWALPVLLVYAYLPLRSLQLPAMLWGHCETWQGFFDHITGRMYAELNFGLTAAQAWRFAYNHTHLVLQDQQWLAVIGVLGTVVLAVRRQAVFVLPVLLFVAGIYFAATYDVGDRANFALPAHLASAVASGFGVAALLSASERIRLRVPLEALGALIILALLILPGPPYWRTGAALRTAYFGSMRGNTRAAQLADAALSAAPRGSVLCSALDELTNALWYRQLVNGRRRDVTLQQVTYIAKPRDREYALSWLRWHLSQGRQVYNSWYAPWLRDEFDVVAGPGVAQVLPRGGARLSALGLAPVPWTTPLPATDSWLLARRGVDAPVSFDAPNPGLPRGVGLHARTLTRVQAQLVHTGRQSPPQEVVLVAIHTDMEDYLAGRRSQPPTGLNDSTDRIYWYWWDTWPLKIDAALSRDTAGLSTLFEAPLWVPDVSALGDYDIRLGLRGAAGYHPDADLVSELRRVREQTVSIGWGRLYLR